MKKVKLLSIIYFVSSFIGIPLWIIGFDLYRFLGASSLVDSFLMGVAVESKLATVFALVWFFGMPVSLICTFIIAMKKQNYLPLLVLMGADLLFSIFTMIYSIFISDTIFFDIFFGGIVRSLYYAFFIRLIKAEKHA